MSFPDGNEKSSGTSSSTTSIGSPHDNDILPHTKEAGDSYYIGDIYDRYRHREDPNPYPIPPGDFGRFPTSTGVSLGPYYDYLRRLSAEWLDIGYLAQWMEVTTQPTKLRFLAPEDKAERASRTSVTVLDFDKDYGHKTQDYNEIVKLKPAFNGSPKDDNDKVHVRLIIVEDLSRDVIETLGARFDIDPLFFRQQISDYTWYNNRDPWVEYSELDLLSKQRPFFRITYVQSRYFENDESLKKGKRQAGHFNVLRRLDPSGYWTPIFDKEKSDVALVRTNLSLWVRPNNGDVEGWLGEERLSLVLQVVICVYKFTHEMSPRSYSYLAPTLGILLVDPPIKEGYPLWGGYRSFSPTPSMHASDVGRGPPRTSPREDIVYWLTTPTPYDLSTSQKPNGFPILLIHKIFQIVCSEWLLMMSHVRARIALIEWELQRPDFLDHGEESFHESIKKLFPWRRRLPFYHDAFSDAFDWITDKQRQTFLSIPTSELEDLIPEFENIRAKFKTIVNHSEKVLAAGTAITSIEESKKATSQNKGVSRITFIALTFAPLSFLSSFFSMTDDVSQLKQTYWIYFAIGIPLTALLLLIAIYSRFLSNLFKNHKREHTKKRDMKMGKKQKV